LASISLPQLRCFRCFDTIAARTASSGELIRSVCSTAKNRRFVLPSIGEDQHKRVSRSDGRIGRRRAPRLPMPSDPRMSLARELIASAWRFRRASSRRFRGVDRLLFRSWRAYTAATPPGGCSRRVARPLRFFRAIFLHGSNTSLRWPSAVPLRIGKGAALAGNGHRGCRLGGPVR
jgi:hypothetical protein